MNTKEINAEQSIPNQSLNLREGNSQLKVIEFKDCNQQCLDQNFVLKTDFQKNQIFSLNFENLSTIQMQNHLKSEIETKNEEIKILQTTVENLRQINTENNKEKNDLKNHNIKIKAESKDNLAKMNHENHRTEWKCQILQKKVTFLH